MCWEISSAGGYAAICFVELLLRKLTIPLGIESV